MYNTFEVLDLAPSSKSSRKTGTIVPIDAYRSHKISNNCLDAVRASPRSTHDDIDDPNSISRITVSTYLFRFSLGVSPFLIFVEFGRREIKKNKEVQGAFLIATLQPLPPLRNNSSPRTDNP